MPPNKASKRPTRSKAPWEKMIAITRVRAGESKAAVARSIDVPESTLRGWCKNAEKIEATTRNPSSSPKSGASTEGRKDKSEAGNVSPQNLNVNNATLPEPPETNANYPAVMNLSRASPQPLSPERELAEFSKYYQAARINQMVQVFKQAQDMTINQYMVGGNAGSSMMMATAAAGVSAHGAAKLPNERIAPEESVRQWLNATNPTSQISPNSSGATLSTPQHNGQQTTSPIAGNTPEQQNLYMEWYKAIMMSRVGLGGPFNMPMPSSTAPAVLYNHLVPNNSESSATVSRPSFPRQPISPRAASSNQPREEIEVPEMHCENEAQKPGTPLSTETLQEGNDQSLVVDLSSPKASSPKSRSIIDGETRGQSPTTTDQSSIADQSSTMPLQSENSMKENPPKPPVKKRKHASIENVVSELKEGVIIGEQEQVGAGIQECIDAAEKFLNTLERNTSHPNVTALHIRQVKSLIASYNSALQISLRKKSKQE